MKKLFVIILISLAGASHAGVRAITDTGEEVILDSDGTWKYTHNSHNNAAKTIQTNDKTFKKAKDASFLVKSTTNDSAYWINTHKWAFRKATNNADAEYEFRLKGQDLYGMTVTERARIPIESLANIALTNAKDTAPDAKTIKEEYRNVNGKKVIYMQMNGTLKGIKFTYLGYYYSDDSGSTQYIAYTASNLVDKYRAEIDDFLNGLTTN